MPSATTPAPVLDRSLRPVLVLMTDHHLGNVVITLPIIDTLASYFEHPVHVMVDERYRDLVALLPSVKHILTYPQQTTKRRGLRNNLKPASITLSMPFRRYRAVINLCYGSRAWGLALASAARHRVGFGDAKRGGIYTTKTPRPLGPHWYDRYATALDSIGRHAAPSWITLEAPADARARIDTLIRHTLPRGDAPIAVIHPSAGKPGRRWPADRFGAVGDRLVETYGMQIAIIGTPREQALMDEVRGAMTHADAATCLSLPLLDLLALFERAALLVSNESGPTHLASTTALPIVTIFGPSDEREWRPIREERLIIVRGRACTTTCGANECAKAPQCVAAVTPDDIMGHVRSLLDEEAPAGDSTTATAGRGSAAD